MIAAMIGNGPSKIFFQKQKNVIKFDIVAGFNFARESYLNLILVSDPNVIRNTKDDDPRVKSIEKLKKKVHNGKMFVSKNTSQVGYEVLTRKGVKEFHIFGHDLMWTEDYTSETDKILPKQGFVNKAKINNLRSYWLQYWTEIIQTPTYIHMPENTNLSFSNDLVYPIYYKEEELS